MLADPMFQTYYNQIGRIVRENLDKENSDYLLEVDFDEYLEYLIADARWEPLEWDETQMTVEPFSVKRQRRDEWRRGGTFQVEEQWLRFRIPISSHPQLADYFKFSPSATRGNEPDWKFEPGILIYEVRATEQAVDKGIEPVRFWLGNRNKDIDAGNIHFSKLRDATRAISEAERTIGEHPSFTEGTISKHSEARFSSRHIHPQDSDQSLEIYHLFVDLSV